jgi:hypothetical protein
MVTVLYEGAYTKIVKHTDEEDTALHGVIDVLDKADDRLIGRVAVDPANVQVAMDRVALIAKSYAAQQATEPEPAPEPAAQLAAIDAVVITPKLLSQYGI